MDAIFALVGTVLEVMFIVGAVGCVLTIPIVAWKMFSVLLERDHDPLEQ